MAQVKAKKTTTARAKKSTTAVAKTKKSPAKKAALKKSAVKKVAPAKAAPAKAAPKPRKLVAANNKTAKNEGSVESFLSKITDREAHQDALAIVDMMSAATKSPAKLWGTSIIGFGEQHLVYESGREMDWMLIGFSPRKGNFALYGMGIQDTNADGLEKLGKHTTGKGCLYIKKLSDVQLPVLKSIMAAAVKGKK